MLFYRSRAFAIIATGIAVNLRGQSTSSGRIPLGWQFGAPRQDPDQNKAAMEEIRKIGFDDLEPAGLAGFDPALLKKQAEEVGISIRSVHIGNDQVVPFNVGWGRPNSGRGGRGGAFDWPAIFAATRNIENPLCIVEGGDANSTFHNMQKYGWGRAA